MACASPRAYQAAMFTQLTRRASCAGIGSFDGCFKARSKPPGRTHIHSRCRPTAAAAASASSKSKEAAVTQDYMRWAADAGIVSPKLTQAYFGDLRGAKALDDISPGEPIVCIPQAAALVVAPQARCPLPGVDQKAWKELPWFVKMAALLLAEAEDGRASRLWGYVEQIPASIEAPVRWSDEELAALQYQPAIDAIKAQQRQWRQHHAALAAAWPGGPGGGGLELQQFLWAAEAVRSRAFSGPWTGSSIADKARTMAVILAGGGAYTAWAHLPLQQALNGVLAALMFNVVYDLLLAKKLKWYAMCPVIDACNHSSAAESEVAFEYFREQFVLATKGAQAKGQQVLISYGAQPNDSLLQYYAFIESGNPHDTYTLPASLGGRQLSLTFGAKGGLVPGSAVAAKAAQPDAAARARELLAALEAESSRLPTSLADDERALAAPHLLPSPRAALAAQFRAEKKRLLQRCITRAKKKKAGP